MKQAIEIEGDRSGFILAALKAFIAHCERAGIPDDTVVRARVTVRGTIRSLKAVAERAEERAGE